MRVPFIITWNQDETSLRTAAAVIAARLNGELRPEEEALDEIRLVVTSDGLEIRDETAEGRGVRVDLDQLDLRRGSRNVSRRQPLGRAIGRETRTVVDATAGLGHDAAIIAGMGFSVIAIERNDVLFVLLEHGCRRALDSPGAGEAIRDRLRLLHGDARELLPTIAPAPDVVYLDPMFPPRRKSSALPKKAIRIVRELVGDDDDWMQLFEVALQCATKRVVLKRADDAPAPPIKPAFSVRASLVRYDVFHAATTR